MPYRETRFPLAGMWQNNISREPCSVSEILGKRINDGTSLVTQSCTLIEEKIEILSPDTSPNYGEGLAAVGAGDGPCHYSSADEVESAADDSQTAVLIESSSNAASDVESYSDQGSTTTLNNFDSYVLLQDTKEKPDSISPSRFPPVSPGKYDHVKSKVLEYIKGKQLYDKK